MKKTSTGFVPREQHQNDLARIVRILPACFRDRIPLALLRIPIAESLVSFLGRKWYIESLSSTSLCRNSMVLPDHLPQ